MGSIARFTGPEAEKLAEEYLNQLQALKKYDFYTVEVNGVINVFEIQEGGISIVHRDITAIELPSYLDSETQKKLLVALTAKHPGAFGTAINIKTLGSSKGNVF